MLRLKNRLKNEMKKTSSVSLNKPQKFFSLSSKLCFQLSADKQRYFGESLHKFITASPKKFWREVSPKHHQYDVFELDGINLDDEKKNIANSFIEHFHSVFTWDDDVLPVLENSSPAISDVVINEEGILHMLLKLDKKKSFGPDDIFNTFLKRYAKWIAKYLHIVFLRSLEDGQLPNDLRTARRISLHESGAKECLKNCHPIFVASSSCNILEDCIHECIVEFLDANKILTECQHGFRKGYSTCTQLVAAINDFSVSINNVKN